MTPIAIHRVTTLDLDVQPWSWPFASERGAEITAHFAGKQREKPQIWNGRLLLLRREDGLALDGVGEEGVDFLARVGVHRLVGIDL